MLIREDIMKVKGRITKEKYFKNLLLWIETPIYVYDFHHLAADNPTLYKELQSLWMRKEFYALVETAEKILRDVKVGRSKGYFFTEVKERVSVSKLLSPYIILEKINPYRFSIVDKNIIRIARNNIEEYAGGCNVKDFQMTQKEINETERLIHQRLSENFTRENVVKFLENYSPIVWNDMTSRFNITMGLVLLSMENN